MRIRSPNRGRGIALIVVMLVIVVLGLMAAGLAYSMKVETRLAQNAAYESELLWMGRSGVELGCWYLAEKGRDPSQAGFDALSQRWAGGPIGTNEPISGLSLEESQLGSGSITVEIVDQERRFNINLARREILQRAMELLGYDLLASATVIDSIEDWRDPDDATQLNGAETDYYLRLARPYVAKNGPVDDLSELLLIQGMTPELLWGAAGGGAGTGGSQLRTAVAGPRLGLGLGQMGLNAGSTVVRGLAELFNTSGMMQVNINTASAAVLQLLPGMDDHLAQEVVRHRAGMDGVDGTEDDAPFHNVGELINVGGMPPQYVQALSRICNVSSQTFEIRVHARVGKYERIYVGVVHRPGRGAVGQMPLLTAYWE